LGLLLAAIAPVVLASLTTAAKMSTIASANQVAVSAVAKTRVSLSNLSGCEAWVTAPPAPATAQDDRGRELTVTTALAPGTTCTAGRTVSFTVRVATAADTYH